LLNGSLVYKETLINTSSRTGLIVMLYQGAIRFLRQAVRDIAAGDATGKGQAVDRAAAIIQHLQSTLDMSRGQKISRELDRIYTYSLNRIFEGSAKLDPEPIEEAIRLLSTLLAAWEEIAGSENKNSPPSGRTIDMAATRRFELHA
jgi:flagellar protein FliS